MVDSENPESNVYASFLKRSKKLLVFFSLLFGNGNQHTIKKDIFLKIIKLLSPPQKKKKKKKNRGRKMNRWKDKTIKISKKEIWRYIYEWSN